MPPDPPAAYAQFERLLALALPGLLAVACFIVIAPFAAALLWAAVIVVSVWRPLEWLTERLGGRRGLVGGLLTLATLAVIVGPAVALGDAAVSAIPELRAMADDLGDAARTHGPALLGQLPLVGERAAAPAPEQPPAT